MRKKTTSEFISEAKKVHNDFYDYSLVSYKNNKTKVKIICPIHGEFEQAPDDHLSGHGCRECGKLNTKKYSTSQFIEKAKLVHSERYDYSLVSYTGNKKKVKIKCLKCGNIFLQTPHEHLAGNGCIYCSGRMKKTTEEFIADAKKIHSDNYDYSDVNYKNNKTKIKIKCLKCGQIFLQKPNTHLRGHGCPFCYTTPKKTTSEFISEAKKAHSDFYDYSMVSYVNSKTRVKIICKKHGVFLQKPNNHLMGHGCPFCKQSKGEQEIAKFLTENNIEFEAEKSFSDLVGIKPLRFDFYIPSKNLLIEYNGEQHYHSVDYFGGEKQLHLQRHYDWLKRRYCKKNGIDLLVIKYDDDLLDKLLLV